MTVLRREDAQVWCRGSHGECRGRIGSSGIPPVVPVFIRCLQHPEIVLNSELRLSLLLAFTHHGPDEAGEFAGYRDHRLL